MNAEQFVDWHRFAITEAAEDAEQLRRMFIAAKRGTPHERALNRGSVAVRMELDHARKVCAEWCAPWFEAPTDAAGGAAL